MSKASPSSSKKRILTLRCRVKDKHAAMLQSKGREVNFVWNYVNDLCLKVLQRENRFLSAYDLHPYTSGVTKEGLSLHSQTVQAVSEEYVTRRKQFKRRRLNWRVSNPKSARRSLGWVPFKASAISYRNGQLHFQGQPIALWDSYGLAQFKGTLGAGSFSEDSRGRWYVNITVALPEFVGPVKPKTESIGIDLGLKQFAGFSDETVDNVVAHRFYRDLEPALAVAQRANKRQRAKAIHAKIANRRKDALHQLSTRLVKDYGAIFVGNVSASAMTQTKAAKSVLDAGWSAFRTMLQYKCDDAGVWFDEVNEAYSTQTCHCCGERTGPKGREELDVRHWVCSTCGAKHDRDRNAARNILRIGQAAWMFQPRTGEAKASEAVRNKAPSGAGPGHGPLAGGIPVL